jgi:hypothetical protein
MLNLRPCCSAGKSQFLQPGRGLGFPESNRQARLAGGDPKTTHSSGRNCRGFGRDWLAHFPAHLQDAPGRNRRTMKVQQELMRHASIHTTMTFMAGCFQIPSDRRTAMSFNWCSSQQFRQGTNEKEPRLQLPDQIIGINGGFWGFMALLKLPVSS